MKVDKNRTIGGAPLIKVRDLLRYMGAGRGGSGRTMTRKEIADRVGLDIADKLVRKGLLAAKKGRDGKPWYELTNASVRLANAKIQHGGPGRKPRPLAPGSAAGQGARLRLIRERLHNNMSQSQFAALMGVEYARYGNWERGYPIPADQAKRIKDITLGITGDYIFWGDTRGLSIETFRKLQSPPRTLDRKRLARIKKACIEANGKEGATIENVLKAVSAGVPDATGEEISAVIEEFGKQAEFAQRFSKQLKDDPQLLADFRKDA